MAEDYAAEKNSLNVLTCSNELHMTTAEAFAELGLSPEDSNNEEFIMNGFEERVINDIANLQNIQFWTRNTDKKGIGFCINGFINHYPDFIIQTKKVVYNLIHQKEFQY